MKESNVVYKQRRNDPSYSSNDFRPDEDMDMEKHGGMIMKRGGYSLKPMKESLMLSSPLAMKVGGIIDSGLYKNVQNIGFGNKTYLSIV
jgi:hypothetical protein